jgi:dolichol-phosphate mannosyltransferase
MDYPFEVLDRMYDSAVNGFDVVAASPDNLGWGLRAFYAVCNWFSGIQPPLSYERLRLSSRRALDAMLHQRERIRDRQVLYRYTGYRYLRLDYPADRKAGHHPRTSLRFGLDVFFSFTDAGVRISRAFFLFFAAVSVVAILLSIIAFISDRETPWELVITTMIAVGFAGLFFVLAVVGEYTARILAEVRSRPIYTMDKTLTWTMTPTETQRVSSGIPTEERVEAEVDEEPFMVRQRRESAEYLQEKRTDRVSPPEPSNHPGPS